MLAIKGGAILSAAVGLPARIEGGVILVEAGKITAVGGPDLAVPAGFEVIDATGCVVTPGFVDAHSHIGIYEDGVGWEGEDANEATDPNTAEVRALDGINPADTAYAEAIEGGVTTVQVAPGSANVIGGEILVMKCRGTVVDEMVIRRPSGLKAALGENPKGAYGSQRKMPTTRMGSAAVMRAALSKARDYLRKQEAAAANPDKTPDRDLRLEMICRVLRREIPLRVHAHRVRKTELDRTLCRNVRASVLFAGPMVARCREVTLPPPGGDVIGRRRLDTHFDALTALDILKHSGKDIPFIIYSGHISDQTAYSAMGEGVSDYIQKGNFARLLPVIDPSARPCHLCSDLPCIAACPDGALIDPGGPERVRLGIAKVEPKRCVTFRGEVCRSCYAACPYPDRAILLIGGRPLVGSDACTGCGLCEQACPEHPKAIHVIAERNLVPGLRVPRDEYDRKG